MENLEPKTRLEQFLSAIAGNDIELPEVKTRLEYFLKEIAENGGESGGGSGANGLVVDGAWGSSPDPEDESKTLYTCTFQNASAIVNAFKAGQQVVLHIPELTGVYKETWDLVGSVYYTSDVLTIYLISSGAMEIDENTNSCSFVYSEGEK